MKITPNLSPNARAAYVCVGLALVPIALILLSGWWSVVVSAAGVAVIFEGAVGF